MSFRGAPPAQGDFDDVPYEEDVSEEQIDEELAGMPDLATAWMEKFGPWLIFFGIVVNIAEMCTSAGGAIETGLSSVQNTAMFGGIQDVTMVMDTVIHNFPAMFIGAIILAVGCQTCTHIFLQPLQVSFRRILTLAQKKQVWKQGKTAVSVGSLVCLGAIGCNMLTDAVFLYSLFHSWVLTVVGIFVLPYLATHALYKGLAAFDEAKSARIIKDQATEIELDVMRRGMADHYNQQYFGGNE